MSTCQLLIAAMRDAILYSVSSYTVMPGCHVNSGLFWEQHQWGLIIHVIIRKEQAMRFMYRDYTFVACVGVLLTAFAPPYDTYRTVTFQKPSSAAAGHLILQQIPRWGDDVPSIWDVFLSGDWCVWFCDTGSSRSMRQALLRAFEVTLSCAGAVTENTLWGKTAAHYTCHCVRVENVSVCH